MRHLFLLQLRQCVAPSERNDKFNMERLLKEPIFLAEIAMHRVSFISEINLSPNSPKGMSFHDQRLFNQFLRMSG